MAARLKLLTAIYDLEYGSVAYDYATFLVRAMKERDDRKCTKLHVVIVPKENGLGGFARHWGKHDAAATRWRLWHIVVALCPLADATVTLAASHKQAAALTHHGECWWPIGKAHFMGPLVKAARNGEAIPKLRATEAARRYVEAGRSSRFVTLTLRNQDTDADRNTNRAEWDALKAWLVLRGYDVVTLNDTNDALKDGKGYAEFDPDLRLALYERAVMNCIGNNGPQELLKFSGAPYLAFGQALTEGWQEHFRKHFHMEPGEQLPWAEKNQRLVYRPDTFEVMKEEFERVVS